ncbi:hypothetical protein BN1182_AU_00110 [Pantoea ananatis]|nr:hypothetical protein BN1182_AU_00110 [Pantoea ananatis]
MVCTDHTICKSQNEINNIINNDEILKHQNTHNKPMHTGEKSCQEYHIN